MVNWFRGRAAKPDKEVESQKAVADVRSATASTITPVIEPCAQPNYTQLDDLTIRESGYRHDFAPIVIIGVGEIGRAIVEKLANWAPAVGGERAISLLAIEMEEKAEPDYEIPEVHQSGLLEHEKIILNFSGDVTNEWYQISETSPRYRPSGRLAFFQVLNREATNKQSPLWNTLKELLQNSHPDVWLVGSTFDVASGFFLELSHLVRLVSKEQNFVPFIGWLLALPGTEWAYMCQAESAAFLRETTRLLRHNTLRIYPAYAPKADNSSLWQQTMRGDEDTSAILFCEPEGELFGQQAVENLVAKMALALFTFSQKKCWLGNAKLRENLRAGRQPSENPFDLIVSTIGVIAHLVPDEEIKTAIRSRMTREVLIERDWGVLQTWSEDQLEEDEAAARTLLEQSRHPLLIALAGIRNRFDQPAQWPEATNADWALAEQLRSQLQHYLDAALPDSGLQTCASLMLSLQNILQDMDVPVDMESLFKVIENVQNQLSGWLAWIKQSRDAYDEILARANRALKEVTEREGYTSVQDASGVDLIHQKLTTGAADIRQRVRQHVRLGWYRNKQNLELTLDVAAPGWKAENHPRRFLADVQQNENIWAAVYSVVQALTQEARYWPTELSADGCKLPDVKDVQNMAKPMLKYSLGQAQQAHMQSGLVIQASGDASWRNRQWFRQGENVVKVDVFSSSYGVLLPISHRIPLSTVGSLPLLNMQYHNSRLAAENLHVFHPEQTALTYERIAFKTIPYRERQELMQCRLSHATLDLFENAAAVDAFLAAWCMGLVEGPETGVYGIVDGPTSLWKVSGVHHPLDAMVAFVQEKPELVTRVSQQVKQKVHETGQNSQEQRLQAITGGWRSSETKDLEWYILIQGFLGRNAR